MVMQLFDYSVFRDTENRRNGVMNTPENLDEKDTVGE